MPRFAISHAGPCLHSQGGGAESAPFRMTGVGHSFVPHGTHLILAERRGTSYFFLASAGEAVQTPNGCSLHLNCDQFCAIEKLDGSFESASDLLEYTLMQTPANKTYVIVGENARSEWYDDARRQARIQAYVHTDHDDYTLKHDRMICKRHPEPVSCCVWWSAPFIVNALLGDDHVDRVSNKKRQCEHVLGLFGDDARTSEALGPRGAVPTPIRGL